MRRKPIFLALLCLLPVTLLAACGADTGGTHVAIASGSTTSAGGAGGGQSTTAGGSGGLGGAGGSTTTGGAGGAGGGAGGAGGAAGGTTATGGAGGVGGDGGAGGEGGAAICPTDGASCGEKDSGQVCAGGQCCEVGKACGSTCCGDAQVCSFLECVTPGVTCYDASECPADSYCDYSLGDDPGIPDPLCQGGQQASGKCLPKPPICDPGKEPKPGEPITCLTKCEYKPPAAQFSPVSKYAWGDWQAPSTRDSVMMAPVVIQLDDDNCDGLVDERDIPEIVFSTFASGNYNDNGTLHAISIVDGAVVEKWSVNAGATSPIHPGRSIAAGNFDGQPGNEIAVCTTDGRVRAYKADGTELWTSSTAGGCTMPSLADLDQNGTVEIIVESRILNGADGTPFLAAFTPANSGNVVAYDVDGDGKLDLVTPTRIYRADGTLLAKTSLGGSYVAVGDLDKTGLPEIVVADNSNHTLVVWRYDAGQPDGALILRQAVDINGPLSPSLCPVGSSGNTRGGGPPTIADFDGDGVADVALAGGVGYAVFDGSKIMDDAVANADTILWIKQTQDCSSAATGSSVFDFDGDGKAEVVYADEKSLHVYAGADGTELFSTCNTSGTLYEYPLVADVDNDGQADLIVASNSYSSLRCDDNTKTSGIRVFGDANGAWVRTRRVWNQHPYHVTNVAEDGTIPTVEAPNYLQPRLNNFRQNVQPLGEFSAPDLVVSIFPKCTNPYGLVARVRNIGEASAIAGIPVGFYLGDPNNGGQLLGTAATTKVLYSVESEDVVLELSNPPPAVSDGTGDLYAVVADGPVPQTFHECRMDNNRSEAGHGACHE